MKSLKAEMKSKHMKNNMDKVAGVFASDSKKTRKKGGIHLQPTRKMVRAKIRELIWNQRSSTSLNLVSSLNSRREERSFGVKQFQPIYNAPVQTYQEAYGVGYERFNNKFVKFDEVV